MTRRPSTTAWSVALAVVATSCLPNDTRPVPGSLYVSATGAAPLLGAKSRLQTADGWTVSYDRFLLSIGQASLEGDSCASYYDADYRRVLDMQVAGPQKVGLLYALGSCDLTFRLAGPDVDALQGQNVSLGDKAFMGTPGTDPYATNRGIDLFAAGKATKGPTTKSFSWAFRSRVTYDDCSALGSGGNNAQLDLKKGVGANLDLQIHGEALFADALDPSRAALRFDPFADADANDDGVVTLDELGEVPLAALRNRATTVDAGTTTRDAQADAQPVSNLYAETADGGPQPWNTLEDYVYLGLVRNVVQLSNGKACKDVSEGDSRR